MSAVAVVRDTPSGRFGVSDLRAGDADGAAATTSGEALAEAGRGGLIGLLGRVIAGIGWLLLSVVVAVELIVAVGALALRVASGRRSSGGPRPSRTARGRRPRPRP